jgi:chemotaxis protein methyltransferase CheR
MNLDTEDFDFFCLKIFELAGISMTSSKLSLVQSRLSSRVSALGLKSFKDYRLYLEDIHQEHEEWQQFTNRLTTNKTEWFRESAHFDYLTQFFLPAWKKLGKERMEVWCAASSTGEEAYTLALVLEEQGINYRITASDIDTKVLTHARSGVYLRDNLQQIPKKYHQHFILGTAEISEWMKVRDHIKENIIFRQINLNNTPYPNKLSFDLIFCRNVMIYFKPPMIEKVASALYEVAADNSMLFIAHSESLQNIKTPWSYVAPSIYKKDHF